MKIQHNYKTTLKFYKKFNISDQKKKKTINEYVELLTKIRNEYAKLQKKKKIIIN